MVGRCPGRPRASRADLRVRRSTLRGRDHQRLRCCGPYGGMGLLPGCRWPRGGPEAPSRVDGARARGCRLRLRRDGSRRGRGSNPRLERAGSSPSTAASGSWRFRNVAIVQSSMARSSRSSGRALRRIAGPRRRRSQDADRSTGEHAPASLIPWSECESATDPDERPLEVVARHGPGGRGRCRAGPEVGPISARGRDAGASSDELAPTSAPPTRSRMASGTDALMLAMLGVGVEARFRGGPRRECRRLRSDRRGARSGRPSCTPTWIPTRPASPRRRSWRPSGRTRGRSW